MNEQSHKREMSAAVRGDFARLRARGVATTIAAAEDTQQSTDQDGAPATTPSQAAPVKRWSLVRRRRH